MSEARPDPAAAAPVGSSREVAGVSPASYTDPVLRPAVSSVSRWREMGAFWVPMLAMWLTVIGMMFSLQRQIGDLRAEVRGDNAALRQEVQQEIAALRQELQQEIATLRQEFGERITRLETLVEILLRAHQLEVPEPAGGGDPLD